MRMRSTVRLVVLMSAAATLGAGPAPAPQAGADCRPTARDRPVCPAQAPNEAANFLDDSARVHKPRNILLEGRAFVGPFAKLLAGDDAPITIGEESNVQDNVTIVAASRRRSS